MPGKSNTNSNQKAKAKKGNNLALKQEKEKPILQNPKIMEKGTAKKGKKKAENQQVSKSWDLKEDIKTEGQKTKARGLSSEVKIEKVPKENLKRNSKGESVSKIVRAEPVLGPTVPLVVPEGFDEDPFSKNFEEISLNENIPDARENIISEAFIKDVYGRSSVISPGKMLKLPEKEGDSPTVSVMLRLNSGKVDHEVLIDPSIKKCFITRRYLEQEESALGSPISYHLRNVTKKYCKSFEVLEGFHHCVLLNIHLDAKTRLIGVPFFVLDVETVSKYGIEFRVVIGKEFMKGYRTKISVGTHPNYATPQINLVPFLKKNQFLVNGSFIVCADLCKDCNSYHAKPISECIEDKSGPATNCGILWSEHDLLAYKRTFYSLPELPTKPGCTQCKCLHGGQCAPKVERTAKEKELSISYGIPQITPDAVPGLEAAMKSQKPYTYKDACERNLDQ